MTERPEGYERSVLVNDEVLPRRLVWSDDNESGIARRRAGKGFVYRTASGGRVDAATVARIKALAIPPAWTDVWICADDCGHLQATGRDAKGRKQYRYHPDYRAHRESVKFERLVDFATALPKIRTQVAHDLALPGMPKPKVVATVVRLLESTLVRVGNEEYARDNGSYGLTTLRNRHAKVTPGTLRLVFKAKQGKAADVTVTDRRLVRVVQRCQDLPGQWLFQYEEDDGEVRPISSSDVNEYLREVAQTPITAKDFRTWMGTLIATAELVTLPPPTSESAANAALVKVFDEVAAELRNTRAVSRASYVHPAVVEWYREGDLAERWEQTSARGSARLLPEERKLLALLRRNQTARRRRNPAVPRSRAA
jgi:DNA topoisomerase-1